MADVRNWDKYIESRWNWTGCGYERGFPRKCAFTDVDAALEFDGHRLIIETKLYGEREANRHAPAILPDYGQRRVLEVFAETGWTVYVLYGYEHGEQPYACYDVRNECVRWFTEDGKRMGSWLSQGERKRLVKRLIDGAMGLDVLD